MYCKGIHNFVINYTGGLCYTECDLWDTFIEGRQGILWDVRLVKFNFVRFEIWKIILWDFEIKVFLFCEITNFYSLFFEISIFIYLFCEIEWTYSLRLKNIIKQTIFDRIIPLSILICKCTFSKFPNFVLFFGIVRFEKLFFEIVRSWK